MNKNNAAFGVVKIDKPDIDTVSSTEGAKKEITKTVSSSTISNTITDSTLPINLQEKIPTLLEWKGANKWVFITGSFCNWKQRFKMNHLKTSSRLILRLLPGIYQYKYIVDGEWQISKDYPTITVQSIINNVIEVKPKTDQIKKENQLKKTKPELTPIERTIIPCPDINMMPIALFNRKWLIPQVLNNHIIISCIHKTDQSYIALYSTNRVRKKTISMFYYIPRHLK